MLAGTFCGVQVAVKRLLPSLCPSTPTIFDDDVEPVGAPVIRRSFDTMESEGAQSNLLSSPGAVPLNGHTHLPQAGALATPPAGRPAQMGRLSRQLHTRVSSWLEYLLNASGLRQRMVRKQVGLGPVADHVVYVQQQLAGVPDQHCACGHVISYRACSMLLASAHTPAAGG